MTDEPRALWDPLWEYVFDDYDVEDEKKQKKAAFGFFSEKTRDEEYEASPRSKKASHRSRKKPDQPEREQDDYSWGWGGAEQPEERQNDKSSWLRSKPSARDGNTAYDTDQSSRSAWNLMGGHENEKKDPDTIIRHIVKEESGDKAITRDETIEKNKTGPLKKLFKRSFRKEEPQLNRNKEARSTQAVAFTIDDSRQKIRLARSRVVQSKTESRTDRSTTEQSKNNESEASFVSMLFEAAGNLDPWMTDTDSDTRTENTDDRTEQTDDRTTDEMAAGRDTKEFPNPRTMSGVTEIRLQHTPTRDPPPEEDTTAQQGKSSRKSTQVSAFSQNSGSIQAVELPETAVLQPVTLERTRGVIGGEFGAGWQSLDIEASTSQDTTSPNPMSRGTASPEGALKEKVSRVPFPSDEYFRKSNKILQSAAEVEAAGVYEAPKGLKRLVCCGAKRYIERGSEESGEDRKREEMLAMLPRSRMISDQQTSIVGKRLDAEYDALVVPSDRFLKSKGPQSLYAYDYKSNQHMDVAYKHFSQQHHAAIDCRTHAELPPMESPSGDRVIVRVEASTISETDCIVRQGTWWRHESVPLPNIPGVDMVGKIYDIKHKDSARYDLHRCQTVLSLIKWGGNARYTPVPVSHLVKVPEAVDPAQAACLPETYLTAFQVLHFGQAGAIRYRENSLRGKSVLIVGSMADNMGRAIIDLALHAGAANIYATAKKKHWNTLIGLGIMPLSQDPSEWILRLEGVIDLLLASNGGLREDVTATHCRALTENGHLILSGNRLVGKDITVGDWKLQQSQFICNKNKSLSRLMDRTHSYDVFEQWEKNLDACKKDLTHLLELLERGVIKPNVLDRIPLNKVGKAHEMLESKQLSGFLVCEPWLKTKKRAVYL